MLEHGGRLRAAAQRHAIALEDWLDLSTGIAPRHLPLPALPDDAWSRLPEPDDQLEALACRYYGAEAVLPVAGSQMAIQALPRLRRDARVGVLSPCYAEHAEAWRREGHRVLEISEGSVHRALDGLDVLVVVNPNNPTGRRLPVEQLLDLHARLAERGGWLVIDEAFMDCTPEHSLAAHSQRPGLIVLRSFGKFFGMAGARLGFVLANVRLLAVLGELLGPWTIGGPTRWLACSMLADQAGQSRQRESLAQDGERLARLLERYGLRPAGGCGLFQWVVTEDPEGIYQHLAQRAILVRLFSHTSSLRFGLPADENGWQRLEKALAERVRAA
ncbi:threonine-phosphate decarboxylase CobD [Stutzerimonas kirkiae]|uniref:threonine-phosphate decarboxylase n=1 Tax=Stutzerimonas kirkiae TaxID=2211392 RepID=A0A4V2KD32_9GAMM|nr:threonine-phosphate decarboxylase CobD [Stutzerimonas kirkiae]TBU97332.1 threonine-phosphate decarboxylase [Stutzerimonas kirkiae]TBV02964.1 threonine-phosphate decarboxylase [Stutzerimonas kirkiae]TBV06639.1 threonine-phosphate decarboxylase [Stutzerimonas kirkiae]TBV13065.1 threonine-phosphate decarboxylase [Stutzerimonas kirkiae]